MQIRSHHPLRACAAGWRAWATIALLFVSSTLPAQLAGLPGAVPPSEEPTQLPVPDPAALRSDWWNYLAPDKDGVEARTSALLETAEKSVAGLPAEQLTAARQSVERLRISLSALPTMVRAKPTAPAPLHLTATYTGREVLQLDRDLRGLQLDLDERRSAATVSARAVKDAWKQLDKALAAYVTARDAPLAERTAAGLEIMADRAEIALTDAEQRLRQRENEILATQIAETRQLRDQALARLAADPERGPDEIRASIDKNQRKLEAQRESLLRLRAERSNLGARPAVPDAELVLADLRITAATIEEALLTARIALYETELDWLAVSTGTIDMDRIVAMEKNLATRLQDLKAIETTIADWSANVQRVMATSLRTAKEDLTAAEVSSRSATLALAETTVTRLVRLHSVLADARFASDVTVRLLAQAAGWRGWFRTQALNRATAALAAADEWLGASLFRIGETPVTTYGLLRVLLALAVALFLSRGIRHLLARYGAQQKGGSSAGLYTIGRLAHYVLIGAALMIGFASIGLDFSRLALFAGALSIGIGFGLQSIVNNFMSGLIILFEQSLKVGDVVELDSGVRGVVREIRVRSTLISTNDGIDVVVPNAEFISGKVINFTLREPYHRIHVPFGVAYGSDKDEVRKVVTETANAVPFTHRDAVRETDVWLVRFGDNSLDFELVVWINPAAVTRPGAVTATYLWEIESALKKHGIQIPFPQRDVRLTITDDDAARLSTRLGA